MQAEIKFKKPSLIIAIAFSIVVPVMIYLKIGLPPLIIVGGAAIAAFFLWLFTYYRRPMEPKIMLPLFVVTVAALQIHIVEEYLTGFGPAMSRLYDIPWSEKGFLMVFALVGPTIYTLTTLGLYYKVPVSGYIACFIFIGPGIAEFTHFIFPLIQPHIEPGNPARITAIIKGVEIADMPNYYYKATGHYYFSGMATAILPMIPGCYSLYRIVKEYRKTRTAE